jgi:putative adhesin
MFRLLVRSLPLVTLVVALASAAPCLALTKDFNQSYCLRPGGSFELQNVNGTVEVQGWDRDTVEIHAVKSAKQRESDLDRVSIDVDAKPAAISLVTRYPQDEGVEVVVDYTVHVPRSARVQHIGTVNGTLRIAGLDAVEDLHTVNGNIEVFESGGNVHAHTTNGSVQLELARLHGKDGAAAETTNGSILLAVPSDTHADLEARSLNGSFSSELPLTMQDSLRPREVHGRLGNGGVLIRLNTVNGGIRVVALRSTI